MATPVIGVVMGSSSDWDVMHHAANILTDFGVPFEARVVSAHRMPDELFRYAEEARGRGLRAIIAGAGGAAHLPGMLAANAALFAIAMLAHDDAALRERLDAFRTRQNEAARAQTADLVPRPA